MSYKIGVFDSGVGGQSIVAAIKKALPDSQVIFIDDKANVPYGSKTKDELLRLVIPKLQELEQAGCQAIVIACNTVSTTIIKELRERLSVPLVGMVPMIKPAAALTKSGVIAVCATPATLASDRYAELKATHAKDLTVLEPDCSRWSYMIEHGAVEEETIRAMTDSVCEAGADVIVLGCTHYHWIEELIRRQAAGRARVIQPTEPVISQLLRVLTQQP